ncbi:asparagine synthetase B family protein [Roseiterribacter gracilis]|uniref:asparagine synthase (glutamine-hydrolyzing) n=1 Tax=Roseiterribacter gracilis TaxID=2812848 RepID=A0A8S8X9N9_9PROT|nr:asparagine synthase [Rhodospirillales bacterium TMPK1]
MLPRFIAVLFEPTSADDSKTARTLIRDLATKPGWARRFESSGMVVFDNAAQHTGQIHLIPEAGGVIYGSLFPAYNARPVAATLRDDVHALPSRRAASIIRHCWGRYVALLDDRSLFPLALRDPSGRSPCYVLRLSGTTRILFSEIEDVLPIVRSHLSVNWNYVRRFLTEHLAATRETAMQNVSELLPGESFTVKDGEDSYALVWNPASFAGDRIDDFEEAAAAVRNVAQFCADRWAEQYGRIVLSLSGGLDSSVIAGLLSRAPGAQKVLCRNLYSDFAEADERHFAALVAEQHGFELITGQHSVVAMDFDNALQKAPITLNPNRTFTGIDAVKDRQQFLDSIEADSFWSGYGGDQLFAADRNIAMARDYVLDRAVPMRLLQVARDASEITGKSIVKVLRTALSSDKDLRTYGDIPMPSFLAAAIQQRRTEADEPIMRNCHSLAPAKANHILSVMASMSANPFEKVADRPVIDFFASQPLMEVCFRIPTYVHNQDGVRRALQRAAFADMLPDAVRTRRGKGSAAADVVDSLLSPRNTRFIRSKVEQGVLVERGLLEPVRTKDVVAFERIPAPPDLNALISCIAVEDWAEKWSAALAA